MTTSRTHLYLSLFFGATVVALCFVVAWMILQPKGRLSCSSFGSYADVLAYFPTSSWLDADKDGKPCELFTYP